MRAELATAVADVLAGPSRSGIELSQAETDTLLAAADLVTLAQRDKKDRITFDSLWVHAKRHYDLAGVAAYWRARMHKELMNALGG